MNNTGTETMRDNAIRDEHRGVREFVPAALREVEPDGPLKGE